MNKVVKAENEKIAAIDFATATETQADGQKRAEIKKAEGIRQAKILEGRGRSPGHPARQRGGRQVLRRQRPAAAQALQPSSRRSKNSKIVLPADSELVNVIGDLAGILPLKDRKAQ